MLMTLRAAQRGGELSGFFLDNIISEWLTFAQAFLCPIGQGTFNVGEFALVSLHR